MDDWTKEEKRHVLDVVDRMEDELKDLGSAVFGDERSGVDGLIKDMRYVRTFIVKWDRREFAVKWLAALVGSNIFLTILGFIFTLVIGG